MYSECRTGVTASRTGSVIGGLFKHVYIYIYIYIYIYVYVNLNIYFFRFLKVQNYLTGSGYEF